MARIRTIKPEFWTSEQVIELSPVARLLFIGMWNFCDDRGVMPAAIRSLKAKVLPADDFRMEDIQGFVTEMITHGLIVEFEADGSRWWSVTGWKHQVINRPTPSRFPEPPRQTPPPSVDGPEDESLRGPSRSTASDTARMSPSHSTAAEVVSDADGTTQDDDSLTTHGVITDDSSLERKGKEGKGKDKSSPEREVGRANVADARGARLTLSELPPDWREYLIGKRKDLDPIETWERFRDYWIAQPGVKGRKSDWAATWRTWVRNENRRANGNGQHHAHQSARDRRDAITQQIWDNVNRHDFSQVD